MGNSELKPCPFCHVPLIITRVTESDGKRLWNVACENVDCSFIVESKGRFFTKGLALAALNTTRTPDNDLIEALESIVEQVNNLNDIYDIRNTAKAALTKARG